MLFNSYAFLFLFLPIVFVGTFLLGNRSKKLAVIWLCIASIVFYAIWDIRFVLLLLLSIAFNYGAGLLIGLSRSNLLMIRAKRILILTIISNLMILGYFKYANFFIITANQVWAESFYLNEIILPLGISFFTFTQIAFLVDVYRGIVREYNFTHYLLFVTYFPHLIAGPVLHHKQMMPQFESPNTFKINIENISVGITIFVLGLGKKVLIADNLSNFATPIFHAASHGYILGFFEAWIGALSYTFQLYFDFSGYSDMAIGLSLLFNVRLPMNFDSPYKARSIIDFWRRWHMTLSTFLRDYLYIPLGGNRNGKIPRYINLMITMILGGLWHGAGWTFIVWGGLHGLYLIINHVWIELKSRLNWAAEGKVVNFLSMSLTFIVVVVAWVFFRAENLFSAFSLLSSMLGLNGATLPESYSNLVKITNLFNIHLSGFITGINITEAIRILLLCFILIWLSPNVNEMLASYKPTLNQYTNTKPHPSSSYIHNSFFINWKLNNTSAIYLGILFTIIMLFMVSNKTSEFLYFQF